MRNIPNWTKSCCSRLPDEPLNILTRGKLNKLRMIFGRYFFIVDVHRCFANIQTPISFSLSYDR
jgi:hypothetical protein